LLRKNLITKPETIVPINPDSRIIQSTSVIFDIIEKAVENAVLGAVKYSVIDIPSIIMRTINRYKKDINQVLRNNIFKINDKPKNITKNKIIETINCITVIISFSLYSNPHYIL